MAHLAGDVLRLDGRRYRSKADPTGSKQHFANLLDSGKPNVFNDT